MGKWGDGEMGKWGDGEVGKWGDGEKKADNLQLITDH
jgi:hypothetical protein